MLLKNKVLVLSEQWYPEGTGGILASHLIAKILQSMRFKLTVVHGTGKPTKVKGINYIYADSLSVRNKQKLWLNCLVLARKRWLLRLISNSDVVYIPRYCYPLIPVAKRFGKRVVVHLHDYQPVSYNAIVMKNGDRMVPKGFRDTIKLEILQHGNVSKALGTLTSPAIRFCRLWLKEADVIICVSKRQAELIGKLAPELMNKLKVVYNPLLDIPFVEKNLDAPTFLYLGGDSYFKGFHLFLKASKVIKRNYPNAKFLITRDLRNANKALVIKFNVLFNSLYSLLGHLTYEEVFKLHSVSYALLFPSIWEEPLPYAVVESMLAGTIPIASIVGGVPEIVTGTFAERMLFDVGNVKKMVDRIEFVSSLSKEELINIGTELRENILEKFSSEKIKRQLFAVFE